MRLVLDTNVWLDWLVFGDPGIAPLRTMAEAGTASIVIDQACAAELRRVLGYPLQKWTLNTENQDSRMAQCLTIARMVKPEHTAGLPACSDPDDQKFLQLAAGTDARFLISKDLALLALARRRPPLSFHIVTPEQFMARLDVKSIGAL